MGYTFTYLIIEFILFELCDFGAISPLFEVLYELFLVQLIFLLSMACKETGILVMPSLSVLKGFFWLCFGEFYIKFEVFDAPGCFFFVWLTFLA